MTRSTSGEASPSTGGSRTWKLVSLLLLWATITYVCIFVAFDFKNIFHSDAAVKSILADLALRQGHVIPTHWVFANGDTLTMTPYVFAVPLTALIGMSYTANMLAAMMGYASLLGAAWFCTRKILGAGNQAAIASMALIASTLSAASLEFIVSQGAYSLYSAAALALFALLAIRSPGKWAAAGMFALAFLLACTNPKRALVMVFAPGLMALAVAAWFSGAQRMRAVSASLRSTAVMALLAGATVGGAVYFLAIVPNIANYNAAASVRLAPPEVILQSIAQMPGDWFRYFLINRPWTELSGPVKLLQLLVWSIVTAILIAPGWIIVTGRGSDRLKYFAWLCYALLASGILPLVITQGLYWSALELRYATLGALVGFIVLAGAIDEWSPTVKTASRLVLLTFSIVAVATAAMWPSLYKPENADAHGVSLNDREQLIALLKSKHVGTALGTYWNSHVISVLSDGSVMVHPVTYGDRLSPFIHHVPFEPVRGTGGKRQAVILSKAEFESDNGSALERQIGKSDEQVVSGPFVVSIYDAPVSDAVFGVGSRFDSPVDKALVSLETGIGAIPTCEGRDKCAMHLRVVNTGKLTLASSGQSPMRIGLQGLNAKGEQVASDLGRMEFPMPLAPGSAATLQTTLGKLSPDVAFVHACLIQEGVGWLCDRTSASNDPDYVPESPLDAADMGVELSKTSIAPCAARPCNTTLQITNTGRYPLSTRGRTPLRLGIRIGEPGTKGSVDVARVDLGGDLAPGQSMQIQVAVPATAPTAAAYRLCLLQENVAWHCERTSIRSSR